VSAAKTKSRLLLWLLLAVIVGLVVYALWPAPLAVESASATRGPMQVAVEDEGETRAHDRFVVAAPIPGRLMRITLEVGDKVRRDQVVAMINPLPLSEKERQEVRARVEASEAAKREADARAESARAGYLLAKQERDRAERLAREGVISAQLLDQARSAELAGAKELEAAKFNAEMAASEVKVARAGLVGLDMSNGHTLKIQVRSPVAGNVLRVDEKSERVVASGTPLLTIGDPTKIEIVVDVLSTDAVKVKPGGDVWLVGWGGDHPIKARVRLVEPSGFTKISALGVEEKRVNVIADFVDSPAALGDGYRVEARIVTWESDNVLKVPRSSVFRDGNGWNVFLIENGRAHKRDVELGHWNDSEAEILGGLAEGARVVVHPSNEVRDGVRIRETRT
jgi:HlyD family secretion protein